jgi:fumarate reductase subunit D
MLEFGQMLGLLSALVLIVAVAAWVKLGLYPALHRVHGEGGNLASIEVASRLIVAAFGLSALATVFAVVGWIGL